MECLKQSKPDKGKAWAVLAICVLLNIIYGIMLYSFGIFYVYFLEKYDQGHTKTSWIGSVLGSTALLTGSFLFLNIPQTYLQLTGFEHRIS